MHGLVLASRIEDLQRRTTEEEDALLGSFHAGDFEHQWVSHTDLSFKNVLRSDSFTLRITAKNVGEERLPLGIGWHPYFTIPSGRREQVRLHLPARRRVIVNDYDEVLPTGEVVPVAGTPYDFSMPGGRPLGDLFFDDCFVDLQRSADGRAVAEVVDPEASYGLGTWRPRRTSRPSKSMARRRRRSSSSTRNSTGPIRSVRNGRRASIPGWRSSSRASL